MSLLGSHPNFPPSGSHGSGSSALLVNGILAVPARSRTPNQLPDYLTASQLGNAPEAETSVEEDPRTYHFNNLYAQTEAKLHALFGREDEAQGGEDIMVVEDQKGLEKSGSTSGGQETTKPTPKKAARTIEDDDYDDSDEDDESVTNASPLKSRSTGSTAIPRISSPSKPAGMPSPAPTSTQGLPSQWQGKSSDDVRKKLEEDKKAAEDAAKRRFHTVFYPVTNDRDAMLEQQKLEESDRQVDVELSGHGNAATANATEGSLSQANLGASSLVLKHLIARIDAKRDQVQASDQELRALMIEVKKNRSKWASEDKVGQEELYEAAEKVLSEIKAITEHSQPFLQRVNKRDAPDYYTTIKHPMDLSSMTKKLKGIQYKSKQEFVDDLNLIWANCLKYNANPDHFLRRHALCMRKETEKLVPLIPDIVIRDRAEVEAEERQLQAVDGDLDGAEDSDDEPIISSRGRKAPGKTSKKGTNPRKATPGDSANGVDVKPQHFQAPQTSTSNLKLEFLRADSDTGMEGSQNGFSTPPPGSLTPAGVLAGSQADPSEVDSHHNGVGPFASHIARYEDPEFQIWKQVTKRGRALVAAERNRLFKGNKINPDEPALLRTKGGMRRWMRNQREAEASGVLGKRKRDIADDGDAEPSGETLAEGMEGTEERVLPDYYDTMSALPDLPERLAWIEDSEGYVVQTSEETLRVVPPGSFTAPKSTLAAKMHANMKTMQDTRKICTKIGVVKQMQLQSQMYQNQFQKYEPKPFLDQDIEPHVVSDDGPVMSGAVSRAAMQRTVGKVFYMAGFEEFQPAALDAITDMAADYMVRLGTTLKSYLEQPKVPVQTRVPGSLVPSVALKPKYSYEESILETLYDHGIDLEPLHNYATDEADRLTTKLGVLQDRMKSHLADLLRPALASDAGPDGVNAFNDGSDQFVGGDFAEDLDEDFFGFKDLGLDKEFGLTSLSVPLHLLQNRMHSAYQAQNPSATATVASAFPIPEPYKPVTIQSLTHEIGLVQDFFLTKLHANIDEPLIEDEDLPQKQRFPKPRLPPNGKITSPRKKPMREPGPGKGHPKKKMRMVEGQGWVKESEIGDLLTGGGGKDKVAGGFGATTNGLLGKLPAKAKAPGSAVTDKTDSRGGELDADGDEDMGDARSGGKGKGKTVLGEGGMISPESLEAT